MLLITSFCSHGNRPQQTTSRDYSNYRITKMKVLTFHSIALTRHFQSTLFSQASLFYCVSLALTFVSPLLIAYSSHGFWIKHQIHRETPEVRFKNQALIIVHSDSTPFPFTWSTFNRYNALMDQYLRLPTVTVSCTLTF